MKLAIHGFWPCIAFFVTDEALEMTEQTKFNISISSFAMMGSNKEETEEEKCLQSKQSTW